MSDNIPFELQENIMKRLPVKSLIQFRSVSKAWKFLIDSPQFISAHSVHHSHSHRLLVGYKKRYNTDKTYVSILDDDTFPREKLDLTVPLSVKLLRGSEVVGSSHGLFCFFRYYVLPADSLRYVAVLWNPSIRKSITINIPNSSDSIESVFGFGFGVCSATRDPKILCAAYHETCIDAQVKVFTLSSGAWQSSSINFPFDLTTRSPPQAAVNGFIYWLVSNRISVRRTCSLVVSFDLATDKFKQVHLPESLALKPPVNLFISKLRDSLAVIDICLDNKCCDVWMMEDGVPNLFTKFFTFMLPAACINRVLGFKDNGEPVLEMQSSFHGLRNQDTVGFYNPVSKGIHYSWIFGCKCTFSAFSYTETLLLLNQKTFDHCFDIDKDVNGDFELSNKDGLFMA